MTTTTHTPTDPGTTTPTDPTLDIPTTDTGASDTGAIGTGTTGTSATSSVAPAPARRERPKRWLELVAAAAIAAVVGSGVTLAVTDPPLADTVSTSATSSTGSVAPGAASPSTAEAGQDWTTVAAKASPAVVAIAVEAQGGGQGSGVVWDGAGHIVTNNHVVAAAGTGGTVQVRIGAQTTYEAKVVGTDPTTDLAVVKLVSPPADLTAIGRASADSLRVGDPVMALGNPLGLSGTVTTGIVSALDRPVTTEAVTPGSGQRGFAPAASGTTEVVTDAIQTSAAINPGNSGGALVDAAGNLVGINSSIASLSSGQGQAGNIGIGFAIPVQEVQTVASQLIEGGTVQHASLGVNVADATVEKGTATIAGAGIQGVTAGSAAAKAGLATGDVVTAVDGRPVDSAEGLVGRVRGMAVGDEVKLTVTGAGGQERTVTATLTARS